MHDRANGWASRTARIPEPDSSAGGPHGGGRARSARSALGFTLIEILVVVTVIAVLAALVAPNVFQHLGTAQDAAARSQIEMLGAALDAFRLDNGRYPTTGQGLEALRGEPTAEPRPRNWRGPYLRREVPLDPWGNPYVYVSPGEANPQSYDLVSLGADGVEGGEGENADILSWE
jgi:general secretion pathway protein G